MGKSFYLGVVTGGLLIAAALWGRDYYALKAVDPIAYVSKANDEDAQMWLLPKDFTLARLYPQPEALAVLEEPEAITLHRRASSGIEVGRYTFESKGTVPTPKNFAVLRSVFQAPNAYNAPAACGFEAGVLIRCSRGEHRLDLMVCFSCEELSWALDGQKPSLTIGFSELGIGCIRSVLIEHFPDELSFKPKRLSLSAPH